MMTSSQHVYEVRPRKEGFALRTLARARGTLTQLLGIVDHLRRRFVRLKLGAHLLDLRCLLVETNA